MLQPSPIVVPLLTLSIFGAMAVPSTASAAVTCSQISTSKDDAEERLSDGDVSNGSDDLDLEPSKAVGLRFRNLSIPQGATISYAYFSFVADDSDSGYSWLRIFGEDHNDAKNFDEEDFEITDRPLTDAFADWVPSAWSEGVEYFSSPVTDIVQEIVDRPGWNSGNDLALIIETYAGERDAVSYDNDASDAPLLCVYY